MPEYVCLLPSWARMFSLGAKRKSGGWIVAESMPLWLLGGPSAEAGKHLAKGGYGRLGGAAAAQGTG